MVTNVQMFLWEHFRALGPKPIEYSATVPNEVVTDVFRTRALRLDRVKQSANKSLTKVVDKEASYNFKPNKYTPQVFIRLSRSRRIAER